MPFKLLITTVTFCFIIGSLFAQETYVTKLDLPYYSENEIQMDSYKQERCVLDLYYPEDKNGFATIIWFHGGGLKGGKKAIPSHFKEKGFGVVAANHRLHPKVKAPVYIEDAATAVAWVFNNIAGFGGDSSLIFISGHSAGGYLASMIGLDRRWLKVHDIDANRIAGLIPLSGHTITHLTVRKERGIPETQPIIDDLAPLYHIRADAPPLLLITGDREMEMLGRYEENAYLMRMMKVVGHEETRLLELDGYGHNMIYPGFPLVIEEVNRIVGNRSTGR